MIKLLEEKSSGIQWRYFLQKNIVLATEIPTMYKSITIFATLFDFVIRIKLKANYV